MEPERDLSKAMREFSGGAPRSELRAIHPKKTAIGECLIEPDCRFS
jgi:hypothetical protein